MRHINWHIGCSGFHYKEWKGEFYPPGLSTSKWFEYYSQHFDTLEINATFYRFPNQKLFHNWYGKAKPGFCFSVKVPKVITHLQKFKNTESLLNDFYLVAKDGLKEKLGPVLYQLPPSMKYDAALLRDMLAQMNILYRNVIEFRHNSWWRSEVFAALKAANVSFCGVSYPDLISDAVVNLPVCYYRFHGVPKLYYSKYKEDFIATIASQLAVGETTEAYVYFNNTASGAAIENAKYLQYLTATI